MNPQSTLQQQFPLSPKKFYKKMISQLFGSIFLGIAVGVISAFIYAAITNQHANLWTGISIGVAGFIVGFCIAAVPYAVYVKAYIKRYYYAGEEHFLTIKKGVFAPTEIHVQFQKIQDVYVDQDIIDRIMGLYDVHIASATVASGIEAHIDGVEKEAAEGLKKFLLEKVSGTGIYSNQQNQVGGQGQPTVQSQQGQQAKSEPVKLNLAEDISEKTYPLTGKWVTVSVISRAISSIAFAFFLVLIFVIKAKDISIQDNLGVIILSFVGLVGVSFVWRLITLFLWKKNYAFSFNADNIYYKDGIFSLSEKHMPYSSIQDVTVSQGFVDRMFGLATVSIENAASQAVVTSKGSRAVFNGILIQGLTPQNANKITDLLKTNVLGRNSSKYGL
ncbi:MAG: hypothetical protein JWO73_785 [Candidatus Taylorbacteria bacterium]|nr:hypothetical protein [Candidatus Taylorbacteria bacterium]